MFYDRIFLTSLIIGVWASIKIFEELLPEKALNYLPKPFALYAILVFVVAMVIHTILLAIAQKRKQRTIPECKHFPSIDILISIHNEEKVIGPTIENLLNINYPNYSIYLINDHSADSTKEILDKYEQLYPKNLKVIHRLDNNISRGKAAALNHVLRQYSRGELIAVFDADAKVEPDYFLKMVPYFTGESVAAVQSQKRVSNPTVNYLTKLQENEYCLDNYLQCGRDMIEGNVELRGNGQILKRNLLEKVGFFDEDTLTEDLELSTRLIINGYQVRFCPETMVLEQAPTNFRALLLQRLRWAEGSLRRYLSNISKIFGPSKATSLSQQFDTFVFLSQFAVPIWLFLDVISEIVRYVKDQETHMTSLMLISLAIWLITCVSLAFGIRIYRGFSWRTSIKRAIETNIYFLSVWPVIVLLTVRKVLFSRTKGKWHKTERYEEAGVNS